MMKSILPSLKRFSYSSLVWRDSQVMPGVTFAVRRLSLSQKIELTQRMRELTLQNEFLRSGEAADQLQASLADLLARKLYLEWGLAEIRGLSVDGLPADVPALIDKGPVNLVDEAIAVIQSETGLTEQERKNC